MGQKANPIGNRLGIIRGWESNWYATKKDYAGKLIEDHKIRTYLNARINKGGISKIVIERTLGKLIITIHRPPQSNYPPETVQFPDNGQLLEF